VQLLQSLPIVPKFLGSHLTHRHEDKMNRRELLKTAFAAAASNLLLGTTRMSALSGLTFQAPGSPSPAPDPQRIDDLVYANRILADQGVFDAFGHVSVRHDKNPAQFLLSRNLAPALVTAKDILVHDLDGNPLDAGDRKPYLERFIHAAIYRARPDVSAVVHSHSPSIIPFGITNTPLRPVYHMSAFLGAGTPLFEIRQTAGMTDMLIRDNKLADALAKSLRENSVVLMRGHGDTVVANSIPQVVYRAIYTEMNARLQAQAAALGPINFLSAEEAAKAAAANDGQVLRPWELWKARIGKVD
jgi:ribulose-5-phosphate 4-epimerase/fuculose-1-phosphate aldolase